MLAPTMTITVAEFSKRRLKIGRTGKLSSLQKSEFLKLITLTFYVKQLNNECELISRVLNCLQLLGF